MMLSIQYIRDTYQKNIGLKLENDHSISALLMKVFKILTTTYLPRDKWLKLQLTVTLGDNLNSSLMINCI